MDADLDGCVPWCHWAQVLAISWDVHLSFLFGSERHTITCELTNIDKLAFFGFIQTTVKVKKANLGC